MAFQPKRTPLHGAVVNWERMLELLDHHMQNEYITCTSTMTKMFNNIIQNPGEEKFRKVKLSNPKFSTTVYNFKGAPDCFRLVGFKDTIEEGFIVLPADADLSLLQKGVDALAAQLVARTAAAEQKKKEDDENYARAKRLKEAAKATKAKQDANAAKFDDAVASISAGGSACDMADEEDAQLEAIEEFMDAKPELKGGKAFDDYAIERQMAAGGGVVIVQFTGSVGTTYHEFAATMKREADGVWTVSKIEKSYVEEMLKKGPEFQEACRRELP